MVGDWMDARSYVMNSIFNQPICAVAKEPEYKKFELTEDMIRNLVGCPEGYEIHIKDDDWSPYRITKDGIVDKEDNEEPFVNLLSYLDGSEYKVEKIEEVEMTMEEVCKALGKNVKIIKGDNE